ncbi:MAG: hypothetical protein N2691_03880 [Patescibacteria group bacterium]|nr:hypothetical protein [Patescibacteria group bacterium]
MPQTSPSQPVEKLHPSSPPKWVVVAGITGAIVVLGIGGYFLFANKGEPTPISRIAARVTLNPQCEYKDPDLCKYLNRASTDISLFSNLSVKSSTKGASSGETVFESQNLDRTRMISFENGKEVYHMISIGNTTYTKDIPNNIWWKQTIDPATPGEDSGIIDMSKEIRDYVKPDVIAEMKIGYEKIGTEACGELTCLKYKMVEPDAELNTTSYILFDTTEYILRRAITETTEGTTISDFTYGVVSISEPKPIKELPTGQGSMPAGSTLPEDAQVEQLMKELPADSFDLGESESEQ